MSKKIVLYIAMSLDGYIADNNGNVDWLGGHTSEEVDYGYDAFIESIDTIVMGRVTYHQLIHDLCPDSWFYPNQKCYVVTSKQLKHDPNVEFTNKNVCDLVNDLKVQEGKDIWIIGGAKLIDPLIKANLIDEYIVTIIPTILGDGIKLFSNSETIPLYLEKSEVFNGMAMLTYKRR